MTSTTVKSMKRATATRMGTSTDVLNEEWVLLELSVRAGDEDGLTPWVFERARGTSRSRPDGSALAL